jgi:hypothetical protein
MTHKVIMVRFAFFIVRPEDMTTPSQTDTAQQKRPRKVSMYRESPAAVRPSGARWEGQRLECGGCFSGAAGSFGESAAGSLGSGEGNLRECFGKAAVSGACFVAHK